MTPNDLGELLARKRLAAGLSQSKLGTRVGMTAQGILAYELGRVGQLKALATWNRLLGVFGLEVAIVVREKQGS